MSAAENRELIRKLNEARSMDQMLGMIADDVRWTLTGTTRFSGTYNGKQELLDKLIYPLFGLMESRGTSTIDNVVAEGDYVIVQSHSNGRRTKSGNDYNNSYCMVYRIAKGKVAEVTEYCDTELVTAAFGK
jgi:ketosteroid isomerase-like protein